MFIAKISKLFLLVNHFYNKGKALINQQGLARPF